MTKLAYKGNLYTRDYAGIKVKLTDSLSFLTVSIIPNDVIVYNARSQIGDESSGYSQELTEWYQNNKGKEMTIFFSLKSNDGKTIGIFTGGFEDNLLGTYLT